MQTSPEPKAENSSDPVIQFQKLIYWFWLTWFWMLF